MDNIAYGRQVKISKNLKEKPHLNYNNDSILQILVHLDLKGAPPKVSFLEKVIFQHSNLCVYSFVF